MLKGNGTNKLTRRWEKCYLQLDYCPTPDDKQGSLIFFRYTYKNTSCYSCELLIVIPDVNP